MKSSVFIVAEMDCPTEEQLIRNRLQAMDGIERLDFNLLARELTVVHRLDDERDILAALESLGMSPVLRSADATVHPTARHSADERRAWLVLAVSGVAAIASEIVAWRLGDESAPLVIGLALGSILLGGRQTLRKGWISLRTLTLNINLLMTLAIGGAMLIGQWPEAAVVTFLFALAERIESYSLDRARNAIRAVIELTPQVATARDEAGAWRTVPVAQVRVGQAIRVKPGERIPLDGVVTAGRSTVNQAPITGESMPVDKGPGEPVFAGSVNERGSFEFEVTADQNDTTLAHIIRVIQEAQAQRGPVERFVDRFARVYTPSVVVLAILIALVPPLVLDASFSEWFYRALVLLVIACPCALVISTPVTVVSGLAAAARRGILIKGGAYLEQGYRLKVLALDKTGTLTHGRPVVTDLIPLNGHSADQVLHIAASLNAHSEHPVASAIVAQWTGADDVVAGSAAGERDGAAAADPKLLPVTHFESVTGLGAQGVLGGRRYFIGNHRLAEENGVCSPAIEDLLERLEREAKTTVVMSSDHQAMAVFAVADSPRDASVAAIRDLHRLGVTTVMLTGDSEATARAIAAQVGIDDVRGNLLAEDKMYAVAALADEFGAVGMVGDGINDAPALARATIGFAMGAAGTDAALETADVALMDDDLRKVPQFIRLSRRTMAILMQNIALAIGLKAIVFVLALTGQATLWMAVFADMGASLLVVANGLRLLRFGSG
jgi:Cd2+/Zn2+-exporting ATPase